MTAVLAVPRLRLEVDGAQIEPAAANRIVGARVSQRSGTPDQIELAFAGPAPSALQPGSALRLSLPATPAPLFTGEVSAVEHELGADGLLTVRVRGYDALHRLRRSGEVRVWTAVTAADVARELAATVGLSVQAGADGPTLERTVQHGQSDLEFLGAIAARAGLGLHLRQDTLHLHDLDTPIGPPIELAWGRTLRSAAVDRNPTAGPRPIALQGQILGALGGDGGAADHDDGDGDGAAVQRPGAVVLDAADAEALVRAERRRQLAAEWVLRGAAAGDPRLRPGAGVRLAAPAVAPELGRDFVLTEVVHTIDDRAGFVSTLSSAPLPRPDNGGPATGSRPPPLISIATVTDVADPQGAGRVRATLDAYGDIETAWLPVLTPAAGADSGLVAQPDVGARVLVLSAGLDPGAGVVLGVLFTGALPDEAVDGGRSRRQSWRTSGGQRIALDDVASTVTVADAAGNQLRLAPELISVEAVGDLHLSAPGRAIVITAASVDFVEG